MKCSLAVAQKLQATRSESEKRKSARHVEHDLGSWQPLVKPERMVDIGNVKGYTGECNIHRISSRAAALMSHPSRSRAQPAQQLRASANILLAQHPRYASNPIPDQLR